MDEIIAAQNLVLNVFAYGSIIAQTFLAKEKAGQPYV